MSETASLTRELRNAIRIVTPYFRSEDRWQAIGLFTCVVAAQLAFVGANVAENYWRNSFYQTLQDRSWDNFLLQFGFFSIICVVWIVSAVYQRYFTQWLTIRWRHWLTARYLDHWLDGPVHYRAMLGPDRVDNPDQRIAEDVKEFVDGVISLAVGVIGAIASLFSFISVLWSLSEVTPLRLFGAHYVIPGYLVWTALIYALLGSFVAHWVGRQLIAIDFEQEQREANFRFGLVRLRENSEAIAMLRGEDSERADLFARFSDIVANWHRLMRWQQYLSLFAESYKQFSRYLPYFALSPLFFGGNMQLGAFMQAGSAFNTVRSSFSYFIGSYVGIAGLAATVQRLSEFDRAMLLADSKLRASTPELIEGLRATNIEVEDAYGKPIAALGQLTLAPAQSILLSAPSGTGKTSLLRAIAGIWPYVTGSIFRPKGVMLAFPQRPYIPLGSLRRALAYPSVPDAYASDALKAALIAVGLPHLVASIDRIDSWDKTLSEGEKQRLSFARVLLAKPSVVLLDEATSALDIETARDLHLLIRNRLPQIAILSTSHDDELDEGHDHTVSLRSVRRTHEAIAQDAPGLIKRILHT